MNSQLTVRENWTDCILRTVAAAVLFYMVLKSQQKPFVVIFTMLGTFLMSQAIKACPIPFARWGSFLTGTLALTMFGVLASSGPGYYNHKLKIFIMVSLCVFAVYFFWEHFSRRQSQPESS